MTLSPGFEPVTSSGAETRATNVCLHIYARQRVERYWLGQIREISKKIKS